MGILLVVAFNFLFQGAQTRPVFATLKYTVQDIITLIDSDHLSEQTVDTVGYKLDWVKIVLQQLSMVENMPWCTEIISTLHCVRGHLTEMATGQAPLFEPTNYGNVGWPAFQIPKESLEGLLEMQFSILRIAQPIGVSVRTVRNRMSQYGLSIRDMYSSIDNDNLDQEVLAILQSFLNTGYKHMIGYLKSAGVRVTKNRVGEAMRRDPVGSAWALTFCLQTIWQRNYNIANPNALWHIGGHHKLVRWGLALSYKCASLYHQAPQRPV